MSPKKLVSGAMSADIAREGQRTMVAPLGHALLEVADGQRQVRELGQRGQQR